MKVKVMPVVSELILILTLIVIQIMMVRIILWYLMNKFKLTSTMKIMHAITKYTIRKKANIHMSMIGNHINPIV